MRENLIEDLNLEVADKADCIEQLFCASILHEGVDVSARILTRYRSWKSVVFECISEEGVNSDT